MQTRGLAKWISEQHRMTRAQLRGKKGRGFKAGPLLACGVLAMLILGAMLGTRITNGIKQGKTSSANEQQLAKESKLLEEQTIPSKPGWSDSQTLLSGAARDADSHPSDLSHDSHQQTVSKAKVVEEAPFQGLWQKQPSHLMSSNQSASQPTKADADPHAAQQGSNSQQAQQGLKPQQAQQESKPQRGSSTGYASQDRQATEYALADKLTAGGNTSQSALPSQQDGLVSKVVNKLLPSTLSSRSQGAEVDHEVADHEAAHYGSTWDAQSNQTIKDSTESEPKATKRPNWTNFLNDNGTTPVVSSGLLSGDLTSSSTQTSGKSALTKPGSGAAEAQHTSSPVSLHTAEALASGVSTSQHGTKASPADSTQSQANSMLSQAGLPISTDDSVPQSDIEQPQLQGIVIDTDASQTNQGQSQSSASQSLGSSHSSLEQSASHTEAGLSQAGLSASLGSSDLSSKTDASPEDMPDDWDWELYLQLNPDVAAAVGQDPASARQHWQQWGQLEQRPYKASVGGSLSSSGQVEASYYQQQQEDEDEASLRRQLEAAAVDQAMDVVFDDMPVLSSSATSSSKAQNRSGEQAAQSVKLSSAAADAGGAATHQERDQVVHDSTTQRPDSTRVELLDS